MAGKLHALITRRYCKGRDWYDFIWYRAQRPQPEPNLVLLQNALDQTEGKGSFQSDKWKDLVRDKIKKLDINQVQQDIRPFLEEQREIDLITKENLESLVRPTD